MGVKMGNFKLPANTHSYRRKITEDVIAWLRVHYLLATFEKVLAVCVEG